MKAKELLAAGQLAAAIEQLNQEVKAHPNDSQLRTFLFELLCFAGEYQRAERQLEVIGHQNVTAEVGVQVYRNILAAERARQQLYTQGRLPDFLSDPPAYIRLHLEAVNRLRENRPSEARKLLEESLQVRPALAGQIDGTPFQEFRDADDVIGPFLEVIVQDKYIWLPFEQVKTLKMPPPKRLRDLLWMQASLEALSGSVGEVFLPVLYTASSDASDDEVRLGRMTDWKEVGAELVRGLGQRLFLVDDEERAMLTVRELEFTPPTQDNVQG